MPPPRTPSTPPTIDERAARIAVVYAVLGALWILLSDAAVAWLVSDSEQATLYQGIKGLAFVVVTAVVVFGLSRSQLRQVDATAARFQHVARHAVVSDVAGGVAHNFNNQLGVIRGYVSLALEGLPKDSAAAGDLSKALVGVDRGARIVKDLLTFTRASEAAACDFDVVGAIAGSEPFLRSVIPSRIRLELDPAGGAIRVWGVRELLIQAVAALVLNAAESYGTGAGQVRLRFAAASGTPVRVRLTVEDDGPGIPPEVLPRIFDPFFTTKPAGSGLGLSLVDSVVREHGGALEVDSAPGKGTRITLVLPGPRAD